MFRWILMPWKLFRYEAPKAQRPRATVKLGLEGLTDRILPSVSALTPLAIDSATSPPAMTQAAPVPSQMVSMMNQWGQLIATIQQDLLGAWKALGQDIAQEVSFVQQQWDRLLGITPNASNRLVGTPAPLPVSGSVSGGGEPVARGGTIIHPLDAPLSVSITSASGNPLNVDFTISGSSNPTASAWLTDAQGNKTNATFIGYSGVIPPPPTQDWSASFPPMNAGDYTLTVQATYLKQTANQSTDVTLPNPPPPK